MNFSTMKAKLEKNLSEVTDKDIASFILGEQQGVERCEQMVRDAIDNLQGVFISQRQMEQFKKELFGSDVVVKATGKMKINGVDCDYKIEGECEGSCPPSAGCPRCFAKREYKFRDIDGQETNSKSFGDKILGEKSPDVCICKSIDEKYAKAGKFAFSACNLCENFEVKEQ